MEDFTKDFEKYEIKFPQNRKGLRSQNDNWFHLPPSQIAKLWRQGLVKKDRAFNRDDVWKDVDHAAWIRGCQLGHNINPLYLIDVRSSYDFAVANDDQYNIDYFGKLLGDDFIFVTCIGGNRGSSTQRSYDAGQLDDEAQWIMTVIRKNATLENAYMSFTYDAKGVPPNRQEKRNGIYRAPARLMREMCESWTGHIFLSPPAGFFKSWPNWHTRMLDDEIVARFAYFVSSQKNSKKKYLMAAEHDILDLVYNEEVGYELEENKVKEASSWMLKFFETYGELRDAGLVNKESLAKRHLYAVQALWAILNDTNCEIRDWKKVVQIYMKWVKQETLSVTPLLQRNRGTKILTYNELLKGASYVDQVEKLIKHTEKDIVKTLRDDNLIIDCRIGFNFQEIAPAYIDHLGVKHDGGLIKVPVRQNGETKEKGFYKDDIEEFIYMDVDTLYNSYYANKLRLDHIIPVKPHDRDLRPGETALFNCEIVTSEYNLWKSNYTPNYNAPITESMILTMEATS